MIKNNPFYYKEIVHTMLLLDLILFVFHSLLISRLIYNHNICKIEINAAIIEKDGKYHFIYDVIDSNNRIRPNSTINLFPN
jgi:hypothetical protein